jgi:Na+-translocating ferredoxin:NAD+ oxidoreductase RnfE subunit
MAENKNSGGTVLKGAVIFNPVLIQLAGLCLVAAASSDVITALVFSVVFMADTLICCFTASLLLKKIPRWLRVAFYLIIGSAVIYPVARASEITGISLNPRMQMYLPLLALNSVTSVHCEQYAVKHSVGKAVEDAFAVSVGFGAVMMILGMIREVLGNGTFAGLDIGITVKLSGLLMPFGAFIVLGYLAMALKWYINKYRPEYNEQTAMRIRRTKVSLRKGKIYEPEESSDDSASSEPDEPQEEGITEMEFLFGNEPEELEIFTEFWLPGEVDAQEVVSDMENMSKEHEQFNRETEQRVEEMFTSLEDSFNFEDLDAVELKPEEEPHTENIFGEDFEFDDDEDGKGEDE